MFFVLKKGEINDMIILSPVCNNYLNLLIQLNKILRLASECAYDGYDGIDNKRAIS